MRPLPRSSIPGITAWQQRWTPRTFTSKACHQSAGSASHVLSWLPVPAFATSSSTAPHSASPRSTDSRDVTSISIARPSISSATDSIWSRERAVTVTDQPSPASARAMFAPIPRPPPVTTAMRSGNGCLDRLERLRVLERREVAGVRSERLRAHGAAHDLRQARLRQRLDEEDAIRLEHPAELARDLVGNLLLRRGGAGKQAAEDPGRLALDLVRHADGRRLPHRRVPDGGGLELGRADPLAGDVHRVVAAAVQEP